MGKVLSVFGCPSEAGVTTISEISKTACVEMVDGKLGHRAAVTDEGGDVLRQSGSADVDRWNAFFLDGFLDLKVFDAGNQAVALLGTKPLRGPVAAPLFAELNAPISGLRHVGADAVEEFAAVAI